MSIFPHRRLGDLIEEVSERNRTLQCTDVYSVTNSQGVVPSEDYFNKKVFSKDLSNYKLVRHEMFAYNPSRINVGSIAWLRDMPCVAVSPLYVIFRIKEADVLPSWIEYFLRSDIGCAQIRGLTSGSVRDSLKYSALERIEIPIAPVEEQQRILVNLATLDKSIKLCGILLEKMDELVKSQFMGYLKGKSALMIFDKHANLKYKFGNRHFWSEGYYVSTVGLNEATIRKYIQEQEKHDIALDKLSVKEYEDPFKGSR